MERRMFLSLIALTGCAGQGLTVADPVRLPRDSIDGAGDPTSAAVARATHAFGHPDTLTGHPGNAARAIADMEYLAAWLPFDPRFNQRDSLLPVRLAQARMEWRAALEIPAEQPAQPLIEALYSVWRAGDQQAAAAALKPELFAPGTLARLADLPPLPKTNQAAVAASRVLAEQNIRNFPRRR